MVCFIFHDVLKDDLAISGFAGTGAEWYKIPLLRFDALVDAIASTSRYPLERLNEPPMVVPQSDRTVLTFDDGGASCFDPIAESLERRGLRGRFFVVTSYLGQPGFLSARQCRQLTERGHIIGSHSESHPAVFSGLPLHAQVEEWRNSRTALEQIVGTSITSASVPGGNFSRTVARSAAEAGYELLFTSEPLIRLSHGPQDLLVAGRYMLTKGSYAPEVTALGRCARTAMAKRWLVWNGRKVLKRTMRPLYDRLRLRVIDARYRESESKARRRRIGEP